jgi:hypothetical protein
VTAAKEWNARGEGGKAQGYKTKGDEEHGQCHMQRVLLLAFAASHLRRRLGGR